MGTNTCGNRGEARNPTREIGTRMTVRITQAQADDAAAEAAAFWPEFGRRWPWTRAAALAPVYLLAGEQTVSLLRAFPAIQWSNQARWYRRIVRDTPAIIVMEPDELRAEVTKLSPGAHSDAAEGKSVHTLIYLIETDPTIATASNETPVARTLLAASDLSVPFYLSQLAHELLNCFCHTSWDGVTLNSGLRRATGTSGSSASHGAALNDLLLDAMLVHYLPATTTVTLPELLEGAQGSYWRIARTLSSRLQGVPALSALFSPAPDALERFERGLAVALDDTDAASSLDALAASHDWAAVQRMLGDD